MNWKQEAINDLFNYNRQRESLNNMSLQIESLEAQFTSVKGASSNAVPIHGGAARIEDRTLYNIVKRERLSMTLSATEKLVKVIERGLKGLNKQERLVLDRFYINRTKDFMSRLIDELGYEQAQIYRIKNEALYKFTIAMYGIPSY